MKLLSLSLRGAIGIQKGLGLDQVDIDFTQLDPGLVAIVAPNGCGKSTLLENLHPFRTLASRSGSLQQHFALKDSHRDLRFSMNGHEYRCRLLIDGVRGKQEAYIYCDDVPMNDGKTPSYDDTVARLFGSEEMFFRSVFRAQGADSIAEMTDGKRKDLFMELLGLTRLAEYHEEAKARAAALSSELETDRARIDVLTSEVQSLGDTVTAMEQADVVLQGARTAVSAAEASVHTNEQTLRDCEAALAAYDAINNELPAAVLSEQSADSSLRDLDEALLELDRQEVAAENTREESTERAQRDSATRTEEAQTKRARLQKIIANVGKIDEGLVALSNAREVLARHDGLAEQDRILRAELATAQEKLRAEEQAWAEWETVRIGHETAINHEGEKQQIAYLNRITQLEQTLATVQAQAALTADVPCAGMAMQSGCTLLSAALQAAGQLPALKAELETARLVDPSDTPDLARMRGVLEAHMSQEPTIDGNLRIDCDRLIVEIDANGYNGLDHNAARQLLADVEAKNWTGLKIEADTAAAAIGELDARIAEITTDTTSRIAEADTRLEQDLARIATDRSRLTTERESASSRLAAASAMVKSLREKLASSEAITEKQTEAQTALTAAQEALSSARKDLESATATHARATVDVESSTRLTAEADAIRDRIAPQLRDLEEWSLLARATSRDGIQALELDEAGPQVSSIANDLLAETFGTRFQISFETTRLDAKGKKLIEVFDIRVTADGVDQSIENLSGGQRVWIEAAISQAVGVYLRRKSGLDLRTSFLDEADGALDVENAWHYLEMLRRAHDASGAHHTFLITHRRELLAHIPQQIRLTPGVGLEYAG